MIMTQKKFSFDKTMKKNKQLLFILFYKYGIEIQIISNKDNGIMFVYFVNRWHYMIKV